MSTHKVAILLICVASVFFTKCGGTTELPYHRFCLCDDSCEFSRDGVCDEITTIAEADGFYYEYHDDSDVRSVQCARCSDCTDCFEFYSHEYMYLEDDLPFEEYYASQGLEYYFYFDETSISTPYEEPFAKTSIMDDPQYVDEYYYQLEEDRGERFAPNVHQATDETAIEDPQAQKQGSEPKVHTITRGSFLFAIIALALFALSTCLLVAACKQSNDHAKHSEEGFEYFENPVENYQPRLHAAASPSKKLLV